MNPRVLIFTGAGKGKTTAALGMALRAMGHGMSVGIVQFIKNDDSVGEIKALKAIADCRLPIADSRAQGDVKAAALHVEIIQGGLGFLPPAGSPELGRHKLAAQAALTHARRMIGSNFDLVILDEVCIAVARELISEAAVLELIGAARPGQCIVLTGRGATPGLIAAADTVTEMTCVKHGFHTGIAAQKGAEM